MSNTWYDEIEADITAKALARGMYPRDYQAQLWLEIRGKNESYAKYFMQGRLL